jgi:hypothetical protein
LSLLFSGYNLERPGQKNPTKADCTNVSLKYLIFLSEKPYSTG